MQQYLEAIGHVLTNGKLHKNRTGVDTLRVFAYTMRFDLSQGFPAVTTKKLAWRSVVGELLWFLEGSTDERRLAEITFEDNRENLIDKKTIWTANADKQGKELGYCNSPTIKMLGPVYGAQWRSFNGQGTNPISYTLDGEGTDQISVVIDQLIQEPDSRRIILSAWNPNRIENMALPPCHLLAHFLVDDGKLNTILYQRSCDMFLGVPFNIASYSLLTHMLAKLAGLDVGEFIWIGGDVHIYTNHIDACIEQMNRKPRSLPTLIMPNFTDLCGLLKTKPSEYILDKYVCHDAIKADMAV